MLLFTNPKYHTNWTFLIREIVASALETPRDKNLILYFAIYDSSPQFHDDSCTGLSCESMSSNSKAPSKAHTWE